MKSSSVSCCMQRQHEFSAKRINFVRTLVKAHFAYLNKPSDRNTPLIDSAARNYIQPVLAHGNLEFKEFISVVSKSINLHQQR